MTMTSDFHSIASDDVRFETHNWGYRFYARLGANGLDVLRSVAGRFFGFGFFLAAVGLWLVPGANWDADLAAMKYAMSLTYLIMSAICFRVAGRKDAPEVHVDLDRQEVRMVTIRNGETHLRRIYDFAELGDVYVRDRAMHVFAQGGHRIATVDLDPA